MRRVLISLFVLMCAGCPAETDPEPGDDSRATCDHNCAERGCLTGAQELQCADACLNETEQVVGDYNRCERVAENCAALQQCAQTQLFVDPPVNGLPNNANAMSNNVTTGQTCNGSCAENNDCATGERCEEILMTGQCCVTGERGMLDTGEFCDSGNDCLTGLCIGFSPQVPACGNMVDDDMDGATDLDDNGCESIDDNDEGEGWGGQICTNTCDSDAECAPAFYCLMTQCWPIE